MSIASYTVFNKDACMETLLLCQGKVLVIHSVQLIEPMGEETMVTWHDKKQ